MSAHLIAFVGRFPVTIVPDRFLGTAHLCNMLLAGYLAAIFIGLSLGLIGGGGSILMVPVLVYVFGQSATAATSYSLFIVGATSLVGAVGSYMRREVDIRIALLFGFTSVLTVLAVRRLLLPFVPEQIGTLGSVQVTKSLLTMLLFAALMIASSVLMIRGRKAGDEAGPVRSKGASLALYGIGIGLVTGLLGAGGGFILIPALLLFVRLPMKAAVGTSLLIISMNSLIGFVGDLGHVDVQWRFLLSLSGLTIFGVLAGGYLRRYVRGEALKKIFGWFVLIIGVYILIKELWLK